MFQNELEALEERAVMAIQKLPKGSGFYAYRNIVHSVDKAVVAVAKAHEALGRAGIQIETEREIAETYPE